MVPQVSQSSPFLPWASGSLSGTQWLGSCLIPKTPRIYSPTVGPLIFHPVAGDTELGKVTELPRLHRVLAGPRLRLWAPFKWLHLLSSMSLATLACEEPPVASVEVTAILADRCYGSPLWSAWPHFNAETSSLLQP